MENEIIKYVEYLFAFALRKCGDVNDAEDLTQETLLAAFKSWWNNCQYEILVDFRSF